MPFRVNKRVAAILLLSFGVFPISSCSRVVYIVHAVNGHYRILNDSIPIQEGLQADSLDADQKDKLRLVGRVKHFGERELGLKRTSNYDTVYLDSNRPPLYTISASPKDRLERITWWFPVVGKIPYLGFFDRQRAEVEREKLLQRDLDVVMGRAQAYSTLGWFRDPVTLNLLDGAIPDLVEVILHEMTHTTIYVAGQGEFNEGLANLVGKIGALQFLEHDYGPGHPLTREAALSVEDERIFSRFLDELLEGLAELYRDAIGYSEKLTGRERIFARAMEQFGHLKKDMNTDRYLPFGQQGLNNAYLLALGLYHRRFNLFETVYDRKGRSIKEMIPFFKELAKEEGNMIDKMGKAFHDSPFFSSSNMIF